MKSILFTALLLLLSQSIVLGAEVDHYTNNKVQKMDNALNILNERANLYINRAIERSNIQQNGCNEESLYKQLQYYFANHSKGQFSKDLLYDDSIPKDVTPLEESVYKDWKIWNGFLLGRKKAKDSPLAFGPMVRLDNILIGTDKFEHLFGMGFNYFERYYKKGKSLTSVLKYGVFLEKTILGGNIIATGIFSFADLSANFNGMRFWNHMLQKNDDVLGPKYNVGPFISCVDKKWIKANDLDFSEYVDLSMDESINCSKFATRNGIKKVNKYIKSFSQSCLNRKDKLSDLDKYQVIIPNNSKDHDISHYIINRDGHEKISYFNEF